MTALICGSFAYDTIMVFNGYFKEHILPDQVHILNVSFLVPDMRREFGGCAGNIAYNLQLLEGDGKPMGTVGSDFGPYATWLEQHHISNEHIKVINSAYTAQAYITTDQDDNQITAFHPGAMNFSHTNRISEAVGITLGIISPDGRQGMIEHAEQFAAAGIPFIFDPGQGMPMFNGDDLNRFLGLATYVAVNDYEAKLLQERTGKSPEQIAKQVKAVIVTRGSEGSLIFTTDTCHQIPPAKARTIKDPTGCGDAYRAGILYGIMQDMDWETTGRLAGLLGSIKIEHAGTQNHVFTLDELKQRFAVAYGYAF